MMVVKAAVGGGLPPFSLLNLSHHTRTNDSLHLTGEKFSRDMLGAAWLIIVLRVHVARVTKKKKKTQDRKGTEKKSAQKGVKRHNPVT